MISSIDPKRIQSPLMRFVNLTGAPLRQLISLNPDYLLDQARKQTGLTDFGSEEFHEPLKVLTGSLANESNLHFVGRLSAQKDLLRCLTNRLRVQEYFKRYPATADVPVPDPVVVTGLPRSGTTFLHRVLSADPANRVLRTWELFNPVPPGIRPAGPDDGRLRAMEQSIARRRKLVLTSHGVELLKSIHPMEANDSEECWPLLQTSLLSDIFGLQNAAHSYSIWLRSQDFTPSYRLYRKQLQIITAAHPAQRLVVKHPGHLAHLDDLFKVFPNARILWLHRDPAEVIPSTCTLALASGVTRRDDLNPLGMGSLVVEWARHRLAKGLEDRLRHAPGCYLDIQYRDLVADPLATVQRIYRFLNIPFDEPLAAAFSDHLQRDRATRSKQVHRYVPEMFGLTAEGIREAFREFEGPLAAAARRL